jgi:hypothetical protein
MPTVLRIGRLRATIYPNDHRPAHVHVIGREGEAVFLLNCPRGPLCVKAFASVHLRYAGSRAN